MMPYERFEAFQACDNLVIGIYRVTKSYPSDERYGLTSQTRRAAVSTAANIVEGSARRGSGEFRRLLDIAIGSLAEVSYLLRLAKRLEYLSETQWRKVDELRDRAGRLTWRLYQAVARKRTSP
jgi:four helix bundle protein